MHSNGSAEPKVTTSVDPEITELLRQIHIAREALQRIGAIAVPPGTDAMAALTEAQQIADEAVRQAGWLPQ